MKRLILVGLFLLLIPATADAGWRLMRCRQTRIWRPCINRVVTRVIHRIPHVRKVERKVERTVVRPVRILPRCVGGVCRR